MQCIATPNLIIMEKKSRFFGGIHNLRNEIVNALNSHNNHKCNNNNYTEFHFDLQKENDINDAICNKIPSKKNQNTVASTTKAVRIAVVLYAKRKTAHNNQYISTCSASCRICTFGSVAQLIFPLFCSHLCDARQLDHRCRRRHRNLLFNVKCRINCNFIMHAFANANYSRYARSLSASHHKRSLLTPFKTLSSRMTHWWLNFKQRDSKPRHANWFT